MYAITKEAEVEKEVLLASPSVEATFGLTPDESQKKIHALLSDIADNEQSKLYDELEEEGFRSGVLLGCTECRPESLPL